MSTRRPRHLGLRRGDTAGRPVAPTTATPPTGPPAGPGAPAPLPPTSDERPGRSRADTSAILRSLIADVVERPPVNEPIPAADTPKAPAAATAAALPRPVC